jgi:hypothetical protein
MRPPKNQVIWAPQIIWDVRFRSRAIEAVNLVLRNPKFAKTLKKGKQPRDRRLAAFIREVRELFKERVSANRDDVARLEKALVALGDEASQQIERAINQLNEGLKQDMKVLLPHATLGGVRDLAEPHLGKPETSLGGNAAISAARHAYLASPEIPQVGFAGVLGEAPSTRRKTVARKRDARRRNGRKRNGREMTRMEEYLHTRPGLADVFKQDRIFKGPIEYATVAISADTAKVMFNVHPGKHSPLVFCCDHWLEHGNVDAPELDTPTFNTIAERICAFFDLDEGNKVLAIGGTNGASVAEWRAFIRDVQKAFKARFAKRFPKKKLRLFVSTSGFRARDGSQDEFAKELFDKVIMKADMVSMSLDELEVIHRVKCDPNPDIPAALKLRALPQGEPCLRVVHSPSGAIADVLRVPQGLINHPDYGKPDGPFLRECLRYAVDGTTAALEDRLARRSTFDQVRGFSGTISDEQRQWSSFDVHYNYPGLMTLLPAGIIGCPSPYARSPGRSSLVGLGAQFDSLLLACLMRQQAA